MGVKNLWDVLESCKKTVPLHHLQNKRVCVDLSCWMVQLHSVSKSHACVKEKVYLRGLFHRLRALIALNCSLIFVSDGAIPAIKLSTYRRRLNVGKEQVQVAQNETNLQKATSLQRNMGSEFSCMIKEAKVLGMALGISCLNGIEEAEAQCALLNFESLCDGCFSSDSDIFLFGARTVYRDICLDGGYVVCYEMTDIERKLGFGRDSLIALSLLLGSDYYQGVHGLGPESACQIVKSIGDKYILKKFASEGLGWVKKRKGGKNDLRPDDNILQVINAYMKPKCHQADSDIVHKALAQYPFQRTKLQQICVGFFEWPSEKTDGYILPNIAERNLRRFANLRLTSSEVGLNLPLHEIPVKCPVSEIIKSRRVQGRECYEVSWEGMDGLETSIVPADLIESACREKILEFEERKAQRKKQNIQKRKPKKKETNSSVAELDLKLQNLLLDINLRDEANFNASDSSGRISRITTDMAEADLNTTDLLPLSHDIEHTGLIQNTSSEVVSSIDKNEIIDLLSPSPPKKSNLFSKCQQSSDQHIEVINLSDSENDMSVERKQKAKELRLFLASIRNEIH
ncbi:single-strand DNA endonuclease 1 isoform X3 [Glycine max]|uniref:Single-strand DNA endonuclease 1 n=1 Tax=Glycine max TaxID=3847 RepID=A0A0R0G3F5_SOYBN|nr:single-strand DNA endonuclease 1 isoform X3 [Glycine max]|eukprot:XP_014624719.1 flap endonuclease GEN-like 2 isoform X3 [Glycine max]